MDWFEQYIVVAGAPKSNFALYVCIYVRSALLKMQRLTIPSFDVEGVANDVSQPLFIGRPWLERKNQFTMYSLEIASWSPPYTIFRKIFFPPIPHPQSTPLFTQDRYSSRSPVQYGSTFCVIAIMSCHIMLI